MTHSWSSYQQAIFDAIRYGDGNLMIRAVAGSGKTTTIVQGATCLPQGSRAVFLAFNKHIVDELKRRLPSSVDCMTIHSLGMKACGKGTRAKLKVDGYKYADIIDAAVALEQTVPPAMHGVFAKTVNQLVNIGRLTLTDFRSRESIDETVAHYDMDADLAEAADAMKVSFDWLIDMAVDVARRALRQGLEAYEQGGLIDFTDMLYLPVIKGLPVWRYDVVMVDEAQDLSRAQLEIVLRAAGGGRIVAVADEFQAIQGFAGADNNSYRAIVERTGAKELPLSVCYRCPTSHIALAQAIVPHIEAAPGAVEGTVETIDMERFAAMPHRGDLIICRVNAPLIGAALRLIAAGIPARIRGGSIGKALARFAEDADKIKVDEAVEAKGWRVAFAERLERLVFIRTEMLTRRKHTEAAMEALRDQADCLSVYLQGNPTIGSTQELINGVNSLFADEGAAVWLSSIHRAKGLEAERVFVLHPEKMALKWKNQLPWQAQQEENLRYVGLTRAKKDLYFVEDRLDTRKELEVRDGAQAVL